MVDNDGSSEQAHGFKPVRGSVGLFKHEIQTTGIDDFPVAELLVESNQIFAGQQFIRINTYEVYKLCAIRTS